MQLGIGVLWLATQDAVVCAEFWRRALRRKAVRSYLIGALQGIAPRVSMKRKLERDRKNDRERAFKTRSTVRTSTLRGKGKRTPISSYKPQICSHSRSRLMCRAYLRIHMTRDRKLKTGQTVWVAEKKPLPELKAYPCTHNNRFC